MDANDDWPRMVLRETTALAVRLSEAQRCTDANASTHGCDASKSSTDKRTSAEASPHFKPSGLVQQRTNHPAATRIDHLKTPDFAARVHWVFTAVCVRSVASHPKTLIDAILRSHFITVAFFDNHLNTVFIVPITVSAIEPRYDLRCPKVAN